MLIAAVRIELPMDQLLSHLDGNVYALDSTTIDLCLKLFPWAQFRRRKAGIKAHMMLDVRVGIPVFLRVTAGGEIEVERPYFRAKGRGGRRRPSNLRR